MTQIEQLFYFSTPLKSMIEANRLIQLIYWRMPGDRTLITTSFTPTVLLATFLPRHLSQEIYPEYRRSSVFHQSNPAVFQAQFYYLSLCLQNQSAPPKRQAELLQRDLWFKYGKTSGISRASFSHFLWRVTQAGHLLLFVEAQPQQFHLLYGRLEAETGSKLTWWWSDAVHNPASGQNEPFLIDPKLFLT